jgi:hypothetical protein
MKLELKLQELIKQERMICKKEMKMEREAEFCPK